MTNPCYVTTSWDDGAAQDCRVLELLERYGLRGTFYVCSGPATFPFALLTKEQWRTIAASQEIGAHTVSHARLTAVSVDTARAEVSGSKAALEQTLGQPVDMFCYPYGAYDEAVRAVVQEAGFTGARTIKRFVMAWPADPWQMATTMRVFPHPYWPRQLVGREWRFALRANSYDLAHLVRLGLPLAAHTSWIEMAKKSFDRTLRSGGVWHLWGHSWEVEQHQMWDQLDAVLRYVAHRSLVRYVTNGELLARNGAP